MARKKLGRKLRERKPRKRENRRKQANGPREGEGGQNAEPSQANMSLIVITRGTFSL